MAAVAVVPFILKDVTLSIALSDYQAAVRSVEFIPSSSIVNWKGLTPSSVFSFGTTATWVCNMTYAQDWTTVGSLSEYLMDNEGSSVTATFTPNAGGAAFTATLIIAPGSVGGAVDAVAEASVSLGVQGKPTRA
jgi:hypothetical protein